jgi:hypothetical protein
MDSVLNERQIKIAAITESKKKQKGKINTNNYIVIYGVNRNIQAQAGVMICIHKSITNTNINYPYWSKTITKVKLNI